MGTGAITLCFAGDAFPLAAMLIVSGHREVAVHRPTGEPTSIAGRASSKPTDVTLDASTATRTVPEAVCIRKKSSDFAPRAMMRFPCRAPTSAGSD